MTIAGRSTVAAMAAGMKTNVSGVPTAATLFGMVYPPPSSKGKTRSRSKRHSRAMARRFHARALWPASVTITSSLGGYWPCAWYAVWTGKSAAASDANIAWSASRFGALDGAGAPSSSSCISSSSVAAASAADGKSHTTRRTWAQSRVLLRVSARRPFSIPGKSSILAASSRFSSTPARGAGVARTTRAPAERVRRSASAAATSADAESRSTVSPEEGPIIAGRGAAGSRSSDGESGGSIRARAELELESACRNRHWVPYSQPWRVSKNLQTGASRVACEKSHRVPRLQRPCA
mmetsp:Transcript_12916/g.42608  ORF Transcript_12916/g.42608 Transcript_12916/m.42608 type:complete len:293 (-) Transcript_12916:1798-2676(-)